MEGKVLARNKKRASTSRSGKELLKYVIVEEEPVKELKIKQDTLRDVVVQALNERELEREMRLAQRIERVVRGMWTFTFEISSLAYEWTKSMVPFSVCAFVVHAGILKAEDRVVAAALVLSGVGAILNFVTCAFRRYGWSE